MIAFLHGRLRDKHPNRLIVDVGGVGYDVHVPLSTYYQLREVGDETSLHVYTHVREDALALYGFATTLELQIFDRLIGISGIGPKLALAVLSGIDAPELIAAVERGNIARLTAIPGIGKKTAERIGLELRDKLAALTPAASPSSSDRPDEALRSDLVSALMNLGYHRPLAEKAINTVLDSAEMPTFEAALKRTLRELAK